MTVQGQSYSPLFCLDFSVVIGKRASLTLREGAVSPESLRAPVGRSKEGLLCPGG